MAPFPRAHEALVERRKLVDYVLSPTHARGRHKARVFRTMLGIGQNDWAYLREKLLDGLLDANEANLRPGHCGFLAEVPIDVEGLNDVWQTVTTVWEIADDNPRPRLVSAYVRRVRLD